LSVLTRFFITPLHCVTIGSQVADQETHTGRSFVSDDVAATTWEVIFRTA
jgi:hypothetical protein